MRWCPLRLRTKDVGTIKHNIFSIKLDIVGIRGIVLNLNILF